MVPKKWVTAYLQENFRKKTFFKKITLDKNGMWFDKFEKIPQTWKPLTFKKHKKISNLQKLDFYFNIKNNGLKSNCNEFVYCNNKEKLKDKIKKFINFYNECRLKQQVIENRSIIKWHDVLKKNLKKNIPIVFDENKIVKSTFKPFNNKYLYLEPLIISGCSKQDQHYNKPNISLCVSFNSDFFDCLIVDNIPNHDMLTHVVCYPMSELIISKPPYNQKEQMAILYALLHHTGYRKAAKNFLKKCLPTIPHLTEENKKDLLFLGQQLMELHLNFEKLEPSKDIFDKNMTKPHDFKQYHSKMPFLSKEALSYKLLNKPLLFTLRKSTLFSKLVTLATKTTAIKVEIDKIILNLK
ncbi:MAG: type ISP restriction/modification enzyme [Candidatus Phytoplasma pyri]